MPVRVTEFAVMDVSVSAVVYIHSLLPVVEVAPAQSELCAPAGGEHRKAVIQARALAIFQDCRSAIEHSHGAVLDVAVLEGDRAGGIRDGQGSIIACTIWAAELTFGTRPWRMLR
jgi:hypothetical protein